jgi:hypothetical protein
MKTNPAAAHRGMRELTFLEKKHSACALLAMEKRKEVIH